jgi:PmbA protein
MNNKQRIELATWASNYALKQGASQVAVSISRSRSVEVEVREQRVETIKESTDNNLSLQLYRDMRFSSHSTNNLNKRQLEKFISEAVEATKYLAPDDDRALPDPSLYPTNLSVDLGLVDPDHFLLTPEQRIQRAMEVEQLVRDVNASTQVLSATGRFSDSFSESVRVHSNGFTGENASTFFRTSASLSVLDNASRPSGSFGMGSRFYNQLLSPEQIAEKAISDTLQQIGQAPAKTGKYTLILDNMIVGNILSRLLSPLSARDIQQKNSFLIDKINQPIASELLTIVDHPLLEGGMASRLFDNEGIAANQRTIIEKGVLKTYLIDNYYGRKLGLTPNGGSTSNLILNPGTRSQTDLIAAQAKAIMVTSFTGGNANSTTGDFSFGISGQLIENGKITRAVNEMNISGNLMNLFENLVELGNDPYLYSSLQSPTMVFNDVDFSGIG